MGQGRAGVESGEAKQDKVRELALKSIFRARAKGSCVGDCCATHVHSLAPTYTHKCQHAHANRREGGGVADGVWEVYHKKKTPSHAHKQHA